MERFCVHCGAWPYRKVPHSCSPRLAIVCRAGRFEFGGEVFATQADAVREAESLFGLLWGPVPSLLNFVDG